MQLPLARHNVDRNQECFLQFAAVNSDRVNLISRVCAGHIAIRRVSRSADANANDAKLVVQRSPSEFDRF
jgi:hypothetical protein